MRCEAEAAAPQHDRSIQRCNVRKEDLITMNSGLAWIKWRLTSRITTGVDPRLAGCLTGPQAFGIVYG